jgi:broad specificity phosphatase PhoE
MNPVVVLCRHGNTFNKGDRVFWVGSREDLPLTEEGLAQARAVADVLAASRIPIARVVSGPLKRTRVFAEEICAKALPHEKPVIDERLSELDYGAWSGRTDAEIEAQYGVAALEPWRQHGIRPSVVNFLPPENVVRDEAAALLEELRTKGGLSVLVTSNGRLRELGRMLGEKSKEPLTSPAVSTGASCVLTCSGSVWRIVGWNLKPADLARAL